VSLKELVELYDWLIKNKHYGYAIVIKAEIENKTLKTKANLKKVFGIE
jgi:hypothetical protein